MISWRRKISLNIVLLGTCLIVLCSYDGSCNYQNNALIVKSIDPLIKVTKDLDKETKETTSYAYAANEEVRIQLVIWNNVPINNISITTSTNLVDPKNISIQKVDYITVKEKSVNISNAIKPSDGRYPDPLVDLSQPFNLPANTVSAYWISFQLPENTKPGTYKLPVKVSGTSENNKAGTIQKNIEVIIKPAVAQRNMYPAFSNWLFIDVPALGPNTNKLKYLNNAKSVTPFDDVYWNKIDQIASFMFQEGQNTILISPLRLAQYSYTNDKLLIDFDRFDKMIMPFIKRNFITRIEGQHICGRSGGWDSDFILQYIKKDEKGKAVFVNNGSPNDKAAQDFYKAYLPALIAHLKSVGVFEKYYQHIADEPTNNNADSYINVAKFINSIAPEIHTIDAIQTKKVVDYVDIPVPQLNIFFDNLDFFENQISKGKEVWIYTAFLPQGNYANRFIEQQALKHRLLFWLMAKYNISGSLNWGFNYWTSDNPFVDLGKKSGNYILPAGDDYIVYPKNNQLLSSIRLESMKDGLNDYALLQQLKKKNPKKAMDIINKVIKGPDDYISDIATFRNVRAELLDNLK